MATDIKPKSKRGGYRPGAGRPKGARSKATLIEKQRLTEMAKAMIPEALEALGRVLRHPETPPSAIVAATALLCDRAFGKPMQHLEHTGKDGGPILHELTREGGDLLAETVPHLEAPISTGNGAVKH